MPLVVLFPRATVWTENLGGIASSVCIPLVLLGNFAIGEVNKQPSPKQAIVIS